MNETALFVQAFHNPLDVMYHPSLRILEMPQSSELRVSQPPAAVAKSGQEQLICNSPGCIHTGDYCLIFLTNYHNAKNNPLKGLFTRGRMSHTFTHYFHAAATFNKTEAIPKRRFNKNFIVISQNYISSQL